MDTFRIGDLAVGCNFCVNCDRNGMLCTITAPLVWTWCLDVTRNYLSYVQTYGVRWIDGREHFVEPHHLRRLPPPEAATGERLIAALFTPKPELEAA